MSKCEIVTFVVPDGPPYYTNTAAKSVSQCQTHGWQFGLQPTEEVCPVGRVEQAVDKAMQKISEALQDALNEINSKQELQRAVHNEMYGRSSNARVIPK